MTVTTVSVLRRGCCRDEARRIHLLPTHRDDFAPVVHLSRPKVAKPESAKPTEMTGICIHIVFLCLILLLFARKYPDLILQRLFPALYNRSSGFILAPF